MKPTASFWCALILAGAIMAPLIMGLIPITRSMLADPYAQIFVPLVLVEPATIVALVVCLFMRLRWAFAVYMALIPFAVISILSTATQLIFHSDQIGGSLGYGVASSLAVTSGLFAAIGLTTILEYVAYHDFQRLPGAAR